MLSDEQALPVLADLLPTFPEEGRSHGSEDDAAKAASEETLSATLPFVLAVLVNLCTDYERAQRKVAKSQAGGRAGIVAGVLTFICMARNRRFAENSLGTALQLLSLLVPQLEDADVAAWKEKVALWNAPTTMLRLVLRKLRPAGVPHAGLQQQHEWEDGRDPSEDADEDGGDPADDMEMSEVVELCTLALSLIAFPSLEPSLLSGGGVLSPTGNLAVFLAAFEAIARGAGEGLGLDEPEPGLTDRLLNSFLRILASASGRDEFVPVAETLAEKWSPASPLGTLISWLRGPEPLSTLPPAVSSLSTTASGRHPVLATAACIALGNVVRSDASATALVQQLGLHTILLAPDGVLRSPSYSIPPSSSTSSSSKLILEPQLVHAALSLLRNLAVAVSNRPAIGGTGPWAEKREILLRNNGLLPDFWAANCMFFDPQPQPHVAVQVRFAAVGLARLLLTGCTHNAVLAVGGSGPGLNGTEQTCLDSLLALFEETVAESDAEAKGSDDKARDEESIEGSIPTPAKALEPITAEAARAVAALLRTLHSDSEISALVESFHRNRGPETLARPVRWLLTRQGPRWSVLRSEALFLLGLLSRGSDASGGPKLALQVVGDASARLALSEAATVKEAPAGTEGTTGGSDAAGSDTAHVRQRHDRENALFVIAEMLKRASQDMSEADRKAYEDLLAKGGGVILAQKDGLGPKSEDSGT